MEGTVKKKKQNKFQFLKIGNQKRDMNFRTRENFSIHLLMCSPNRNGALKLSDGRSDESTLLTRWNRGNYARILHLSAPKNTNNLVLVKSCTSEVLTNNSLFWFGIQILFGMFPKIRLLHSSCNLSSAAVFSQQPAATRLIMSFEPHKVQSESSASMQIPKEAVDALKIEKFIPRDTRSSRPATYIPQHGQKRM